MRVFVLGTGRCGTTTFAKACNHITNYSSGHETNRSKIGEERFKYPSNHIEVDSRLVWFLGALHQRYPKALYVHLRRNREATVQSMVNRWGRGMVNAFAHQIVLKNDWSELERRGVCYFLYDTAISNIEHFLQDKQSLTINLEAIEIEFPLFLDRIGAKGWHNSIAEWAIKHNSGS